MVGDASVLPHVNAALNATTTALLLIGWRLIRAKRVTAHRAVMLTALATSVAFLVSYLIYHAQIGSRPFPAGGWARRIYLAILLTHTIAAAAIVPLVIVTASRGLRMRVEAHRRIARWTLPLWLYVSVTGVIVYWMLYRISW